MKKNNSFLSEDDKKVFYLSKSTPNWQRILIRKTVPADNGSTQKTTPPVELDKLFDRFINSPKVFHCYCIETKPDDGMSWAAETVRSKLQEAISESRSPFEIITISRLFERKMPVIIDVIGIKNFLNLAEKNKLAADFFSFHTLSTLLICLASFATPILAGLITNDLGKPGGLGNLLTPLYAIIAIATLLISFLIRHYSRQSALNPQANTVMNLVAEIHAYSKKAEEGDPGIENRLAFEALIDDSAHFLFGIVPKFVIIDDYQNLDYFTKQVIEKYFRHYKESPNSKQSQRECWVIFERQTNDKFSNHKTETRAKTGTAFPDITPLKLAAIADAEKIELLKRNNLPEENFIFTNIKSVCMDFEGLGWVKENLKKYRSIKQDTKGFDKLELLYLLALTSFPGKISFSPYEFDTIFENNRTRSELLKGFMCGKDFSRSSMRKLKAGITEDLLLKDVVEVSVTSLDERFSLTYEASLLINRDSEYYDVYPDEGFLKGLSLPDEMPGHAFWAVYWYDRLQSNHPNETFWFNKLSYHLTSFDFQTIRAAHDEKNSRFTTNEILFYILESYIYTIGGTIRTAAFGNVEELVAYAASAVEEVRNDMLKKDNKDKYEETRKELFSKVTRLYAKCWEAYICFGHNSIFRNMESISEIAALLADENSIDQEYQDHCMIYFGLMTPESPKGCLAKDEKHLLFSGKPLFESIEEHIILSSILLGFSIRPVVEIKSSLALGKFSTEEFDRITSIFEKIENRISSSTSKTFFITDLINLSSIIWCTAIGIHHRIASKEDGLDKLQGVLKKCAVIIRFLNEDKFLGNKRVIKNEFFLNALASEIAGLTMACCIIGLHSVEIRENRIEFSKTVNDFILLINELFDIRYNIIDKPESLTTDAIFKKAVLFLQTTSAVWSKLGFIGFSNSLNQKIFQFKLICYSKDIETIKYLIERESPVLKDPSVFLQFETRLHIAVAVRTIHYAYSYFFFTDALKWVERRTCTKKIYYDLLIIKILYKGAGREKFTDYERVLLEEQDFINYFTGDFVMILNDEELNYFLTVLGNESSLGNAITDKLIPAISNKANAVLNPTLKKKLTGLTKYLQFNKKWEKKMRIEDVITILDEWKEERDNDLYPFVLYKCLDKIGQLNDVLCNEIEQILDRDGEGDIINTYLILAYEYAFMVDRQEGRSLNRSIIKYIMDTNEAFEEVNNAGNNKKIYYILEKYADVGVQAHYHSKYMKWEKIIQEEKRLEFQANLQNQNFFIAFKSMVDDLKKYSGEDLKKIFLEETIKDDKLSPFKEKDGKKYISLYFIEQGANLFFNEKHADAAYDEQRAILNNLAIESFEEVFNFLIAASSSDYFREIAERYNKAYKEYTMPEIA